MTGVQTCALPILRKQFVQKFNGDEYITDVRNTIISGSRDIEITDIANRDQGYVLAKFSNISSTGVAGISTTFVETDFPLFRYADVMLMYAEAQVRKDGTANTTSLGYINELRTRANNGSTVNNVSLSRVTLDFILDERSRELHWEAHRRQDLIRFNKYTGGIMKIGLGKKLVSLMELILWKGRLITLLAVLFSFISSLALFIAGSKKITGSILSTIANSSGDMDYNYLLVDIIGA